MSDGIYLTKQDNIANIIFDNPSLPVNVLSTPVMQRFADILDEIEKDSSIQGILITSNKKGIFIAGADIKEVEGITTEREGREKAEAGQKLFNKLAGLKIPTLAVINGAALGGGLELALACKYRVASFSEKVQLGLPEVKLGLIPGFGGTVRLPKLIGLKQALAMIPAGRVVSGKEALRMGLVDKLFPENILMEEAVNFLRKPAGRKKPAKGIIPAWFMCKIARKKTLEKTRGFYPAPIKAISAIRKGVLEYEAKTFGELVVTETAKNLIHVFFLSEKYKHKDWGLKDITPYQITKCGVIGAGIMGGGIAQLVTMRNIPVRIKDLSIEAIGKALRTARKIYEYPLKTKKIKPHEVDYKMGLISGTTDDKGFGNTDIVIEAVVEDMAVKEKVFSGLRDTVSGKTILATNTSSLPVTKMAEKTKDPSKVIGMHFFNPVDRMPLVEIITTRYTSPETTATVLSFARQLGKTAVIVKDKTGFLVNRLLLPYMNSAAFLLMKGNPIEHIDSSLLKFGMPMGPLELADEVGIDTAYKVAKIMEDEFGERMAVAPVIKQIVSMGLLGKKTGRGFYIHKGKQKKPNQKIYSLITPGKEKEILPKETIQKQLITLMQDEAQLILKEGTADSPDTIDIAMIFGAGFPPFRGGLFKE